MYQYLDSPSQPGHPVMLAVIPDNDGTQYRCLYGAGTLTGTVLVLVQQLYCICTGTSTGASCAVPLRKDGILP